MAEMLLINPRKRRKARRASPVRAKRRAASTRRRRRSNPISARAVVMAPRRRVAYRRKRRSNPIASRRRRRNPIGLGGGGSIMSILKSAAIGGAGAIAVDLAMGQVAKFLPASLAKVPGKIGTYEAVKVGVTIMLGKLLSRSTRGLSQKMAMGSLTVQAHQMLASVVPTGTMPLGYYSPATIAQGVPRVGPIRPGVNMYTRPGQTALLNAYTRPGVSPLLNNARQRERAVR